MQLLFCYGCYTFDEKEKVAYYSDRSNYIVKSGEIVNIISRIDDSLYYSDVYQTIIDVDVGERISNVPDYYFKEGNIARLTICIPIKNGKLSERGWVPGIGDQIVFTTATKVWNGQPVFPIVELYYNDICYLEFEEGQEGLITHIKDTTIGCG